MVSSPPSWHGVSIRLIFQPKYLIVQEETHKDKRGETATTKRTASLSSSIIIHVTCFEHSLFIRTNDTYNIPICINMFIYIYILLVPIRFLLLKYLAFSIF
jgi:hypothetical protein